MCVCMRACLRVRVFEYSCQLVFRVSRCIVQLIAFEKTGMSDCGVVRNKQTITFCVASVG